MAIWKSKRFETWQRENPGESFAQFYAETSMRKRRDGVAHANLGANLKTGEFGESGISTFRKIVTLGLKPEDTLVDYGCGTLRMGVHAMKYLQPGRYWGLEISQDFLDQGRELVGAELIAEKRPQLATISPQSVAEAAAARPDMVISTRVFNHVHPDELPLYFHNLMRLVGASGKAVITGKWSEGETIQHKSRSWTHSMALMRELVAKDGGVLTIIEHARKDKVGEGARIGLFSLQRVP
jgi:hypothetical protein